MSSFELNTMEPLETLVSAVPTWYVLLDDLDSKITRRQVELAQVGEYRPPTRSIKNKGSTESLRPRENESPITATDKFHDDPMITTPHELPTLTQDTVFAQTSNSPISKPTNAAKLMHHSSSPGPQTPNRNIAQRVKGAGAAMSPPVIRKRKTDSVASGESQKPKYRTRSMIIVYYDSAVQIAFEELVKHISSSRNSMRKGKMTARMASMRRMAEMSVDDDDTDDLVDTPGVDTTGKGFGSNLIVARNPLDSEDGDGEAMPVLKFVSTRRMGPSMAPPTAIIRNTTNRANLGLDSAAKTGERTNRGIIPKLAAQPSANIYDELDTGLEWCQSMCEHAAHQFLRDGECTMEIVGIKKRLTEVKGTAERAIAKASISDPKAKPNTSQEPEEGADLEKLESSRARKSILVRKNEEKDGGGNPSPRDLIEVDEMEIDTPAR
jgi:hypothetical protein